MKGLKRDEKILIASKECFTDHFRYQLELIIFDFKELNNSSEKFLVKIIIFVFGLIKQCDTIQSRPKPFKLINIQTIFTFCSKLLRFKWISIKF